MTVRRCTALLSQSAPGEGRWLGDVIGQLARHAALMLFCITTYALAPVAGLGWLIATMGLAQCWWDQRALRAAYEPFTPRRDG